MQVVVNLLSNAIKFTPDGGTIEVRVRPLQDGGVAIDVEDNGVGVEAAEIPRLFTAFAQAKDLSVRTHEQGTGLGLALCKQLIELHGGSVHMQSVPGQGTTVTVVLPKYRVRATVAE